MNAKASIEHDRIVQYQLALALGVPVSLESGWKIASNFVLLLQQLCTFYNFIFFQMIHMHFMMVQVTGVSDVRPSDPRLR